MEPLKRIERKRRHRDALYEDANRILVDEIEAAREAGSSWPAIAQAMGMTRQGLFKFRNRESGGGR